MTDTLDRLDKLMIGLREREVNTIEAYRELVKLFPAIKEAVTLHDQVKTPEGMEATTLDALQKIEPSPKEGSICKEDGTFEDEFLKAAALKWSLLCQARQHIPQPLSTLLINATLYLPNRADAKPTASFELLQDAYLQIDSELVIASIYTRDLAENPKQAIKHLIQWHVDVALDPQVSARAQALRDDGAVGANSRSERPSEASPSRSHGPSLSPDSSEPKNQKTL